MSVITLALLFAVGEGIYRLRERGKRVEILAGREPAELLTRPAEPPQYYALKPDLPDFTNRAGFRDLERRREKQAGTIRVVVIGDSVSMQGRLPFEDLYVRHLQRLLDDEFPGRVEILNCAVTGYNTVQEASLFERTALAYDPDLVLWQIHDNDGNHPVYESERGRYYHRPSSYFASFLGRRLDHLRKKTFIRREGLGDAGYEHQNMLFRWDRVTGDIRRVADLLRARDADLLVFLYPSWPTDDDWDRYGEAGAEIHRQLVAYLETLGVGSVDLLPAFRELDPARYRVEPSDPWHPNARGHQRIAEILLPFLRTRIHEFD